MKGSLILGSASFLLCAALGVLVANVPLASASFNKGDAMKVQYLEIVTRDVDGVLAAYASALNVEFSEPIAGLGGARTASMPGGGLLGIRAPLRDDEDPVVRPYWLVPDIDAALEAVVQAGGEVALPPMEIPGHGSFAIYQQGGNDHGLWEL